jgi:hypothetical protein
MVIPQGTRLEHGNGNLVIETTPAMRNPAPALNAGAGTVASSLPEKTLCGDGKFLQKRDGASQ